MLNATGQNAMSPGVISTNRTFFIIWGLSLPMLAVIFLTLMANGTVLLMFLRRRALRKYKNIHIASLAMADLSIGLTMPIAMFQDLNPKWALEGLICKWSLTIRHSLLCVSVFSILLINVDRWWSINYPFSYRVRRSRRLAIGAVSLCWFLSFGVHIHSILLWDIVADTTDFNASSESTFCIVPYSKHVAFVFTVNTLEYLIPVIVMWALNCSIYFKINRRKRIKIRRSLSTTDAFILTLIKSSSEVDYTTNLSDECANILQSNAPRLDIRRTSLTKNRSRRHSIANTSRHISAQLQCSRTSNKRRMSHSTLLTEAVNGPGTSRKHTALFRNSSARRKPSDELVKDLLVKQEKKAACSLGLVVLVFTVCWIQHILVSVVEAKCLSCLADWVHVVSHWILMANSAVNPILYGWLNAEFRKVMRQWFSYPKRRKYRLKNALLHWNLNHVMDSD